MATETLENFERQQRKQPARRLLPEQISLQFLREIFELGLISFGFYGLLYWLPRGYFLDGNIRLYAMLDLFQHGVITKMNYSYLGPAFSYPLWWIDQLKNDHRWWIERYNVFLCIAVFLITYLLLRKRMNANVLRAFLLLFMFASIYSSQYIYFGGEVFTSLLAGMGILIALLVTEFGGWIAVALGVANTPASLVAAGLVSLRYMVHKKRLRYALVVILAVVLIGIMNWITRGNPLTNGYANQPFNTPFIIGLLSLFFSFGKGLIFFMPALFVPVKKSLFQIEGENKEKIYMAYKLWLYFVAGLVLIYASWWAWDGGWFWGPRFFLFASIPASFVLAVRLQNPSKSLLVNMLILVLFAYTAWVATAGAIFDQGNLNQTCLANQHALLDFCRYSPTYSVLWAPLANHWHIPRHGWRYILFSLVVFAYLAIPTLLTMARQVQEKFLEVKAYLPEMKVWLKAWRA